MNLSEEIRSLTAEADKAALGGEINTWVPGETHEKYGALQNRTKRKFTRILRKAMVQIINQAYDELVV